MGLGLVARFTGELTELATQCEDPRDLARWTLERVSKVVPCDSALYMPMPFGPKGPVAINRETNYRQLYGLLRRDPERMLSGLQRGPSLGTYLDHEAYTARERRELPLYAEIIRPQGITSQLVAHLSFGGQPLGVMYVCRHGRSRPFARRHLERFRPLIASIVLSQAALRASGPCAELDLLTPREREVATHVGRGLQNQNVAAVMGISANTVRNQLSRIFEKLKVGSRAELAARMR
jgi:DNA-binding CsgD family transcriptional regulator